MARCRLAPALVAALCLSAPAWADPTAVDRTLAVQAALADARDLLTSNKPAAAVELLERTLPLADGSRPFLDLLRSAYAAEYKKLLMSGVNPQRVADLKTKLALLGVSPGEPTPEPPAQTPVAAVEPAPAPQPVPAPAPAPGVDLLGQASALFAQGKAEPKKLGLAAKLFAAAFADRVEMSADQHAAWAYCRLRVAADKLGRPGADPAEVAAEIEEALRLAPDNPAVVKAGRDLLAVVKLKAATAPAPAPAQSASASDGWELLETASFRVRFVGNRPFAEAVAKAAEAKRAEVFSRWSGPPGGPWEPKCEVVIHPDAAAFAQATKQPPQATGHALVKLDAGRALARRIDLRADDPSAAEDALPRELTHVVLADLFPTTAPPRWAAEGMAVLAASPGELDRYLRTASKCQQSGSLPGVSALLAAAEPPADKVTGFYAGSASLVEFLVRWKGDKAFTTFLRDSQRYGTAAALKRQYGVGDPSQLEAAWVRGGLSGSARGQAPAQ